MRKLIIILFCLITTLSFANHIDKMELRKQYYQSLDNKKLADDFMFKMESISVEHDALLLAYKGMAYFLEANLSINPYAKYTYFKKGKSLLEEAVNKNPWNAEIRFMRFCVQTSAPKFLGYIANIETDKYYLVEQWKGLNDADLKNKISNYMLTLSCFNDSQKTNFK